MMKSSRGDQVLRIHGKSLGQRIFHKLIIRNEWQLYLMVLPAVLFFLIFHYVPMYGIQIAFRNYRITRTISESPFVGFQYFRQFFNSPMFSHLFKNTLILALYDLLARFPFPIIFAVILNHTRSQRLVKSTQTITFAPYFISMIVLVGMLHLFLSPTSGIVNVIRQRMGKDSIYFMGEAEWFRHVYVLSNIWQRTGYQAIIYFAALTAVDPGLYEAATIDGASKLQKILYIDLPSLMPTMVTLLLLSVGTVLNIDTQRTLVMQATTNLETSEIFGTYVYKVGLVNSQFSYSTAINLFQTTVNLILLITVNTISRRIADEGLW